MSYSSAVGDLYGSASHDRNNLYDNDINMDRDRRKRERSSSVDGDDRKRRRNNSPHSNSRDQDSYIPNYQRDGYVPAPRRSGYDRGPDRSGQGYGFDMTGRRNEGDPLDLNYLVSYRQFAEYTKAKHKSSGGRSTELDDEEIRKKFQAYRDRYQSKMLNAFFEEHKNSEWFREKYHPTECKPLKEETISRKKAAYPSFVVELQEGKLDNIKFDLPEGSDAAVATVGAEKEVGDDEMADVNGGSKVDAAAATGNDHLPPPLKMSALFLKSVPSNIKRQQLLDVFKTLDGVEHLLLSDPRSDKRFVRLAWIIFKEGTDLEKAMTEINGKKINEFVIAAVLHNNTPSRIRALPAEFNLKPRLEHDLENAKRVAKALDLECGFDSLEGKGCAVVEARLDVIFVDESYHVEEPVSAADAEDEAMKDAEVVGEEKPAAVKKTSTSAFQQDSGSVKRIKKALDFYIEYLRRVHWYDYYSGIEADGPEDFARRAWLSLRKLVPAGGIVADPSVPRFAKTEYQKASERLDNRVVIRTLNLEPGPDNWGGDELIKIGGKNPEEEINRYLVSKFITKIDQEKYRCVDCSKLFRGEEFVNKHIRNKHPRIVEEFKVDIDYYNAYVRDPNRVHTMSAQPPPGSAGGGMGGIGGGGMMDMTGRGMGIGMGIGMGMGMGGGFPGGGMMAGWNNMMLATGGMGMGGMGGGMMRVAMGGGRGGRGGRGGYGGGRYGSGGGSMESRLGPAVPRSTKGLPVDPRAGQQRRYDDLDTAPKGEVEDLNYD